MLELVWGGFVVMAEAAIVKNDVDGGRGFMCDYPDAAPLTKTLAALVAHNSTQPNPTARARADYFGTARGPGRWHISIQHD